MVLISSDIDYAIFFIAAAITILVLIYKSSVIIVNFLNKIKQFPNELTNLKSKHNNINEDIQILKEKIYRIDGQMDICCRIIDNLTID